MNIPSNESSTENEKATRNAVPIPCMNTGRVCQVCGDKANGYNFGVLSCESCKAFFRRNAGKSKEIKCPFANSCGITSASRRFCQACRLKKCFTVGMQNGWLLEPMRDQKRPRRKKHTEEKLSPRSHCTCTCKCGFFPTGTSLFNSTGVNISMIESARGVNEKISELNQGVPPKEFPRRNDLSENLSSCLKPLPVPFVQSINARTNHQALNIVNPFKHLDNDNGNSFWNCTMEIKPSFGLNPVSQVSTLIKMANSSNKEKYAGLLPHEFLLLQELVRAAEPLNNPLDMQFDNQQLSLLDIVRITETALRRIVCMARELESFTVLSLEDKKTLIKGSCSELMILRGVMAYDAQKKMWSHSFTQDMRGMEIKLDVLKRTVESQHFEEHKRFLESFDDRVRKAENVILVLMAILIFQADRPRLEEQGRVAETQERYMILLKKVLECEFGHNEAKSMFNRLLCNLNDLRQLNQGLVRIYCGFDSMQLDPLIKELFDM